MWQNRTYFYLKFIETCWTGQESQSRVTRVDRPDGREKLWGIIYKGEWNFTRGHGC